MTRSTRSTVEDVTNAQERVDRAQTAYDALVADNAKFAETVTWLAGAIDRGREFTTYYENEWLTDRDEVGVHLPVMGEDEPWEAVGDHLKQLRRLLRIVTNGLVGPLEPGDATHDAE